ncbi:hypothetical protein SNE40_023628 [Patella caerulea]|uniref:protein xylosyltransferase n=1 Tax=Patella caerulea TaxID=87958 RepID=A0AAN8G7H0_PATCE
MAASRIGSWKRICLRYKYFFYAAFIVCVFQVFLAYSFYKVNLSDKENNENAGPQSSESDSGKFDSRLTGYNDYLKAKQKTPNKVVSIQGLSDDVDNSVHGDEEVVELEPPAPHTTFIPKCKIIGKDALSALERAKTNKCRQEIADVVCLEQEKKLYVKSLPRSCPVEANTTGSYFGCFQDNKTDRDMPKHFKEIIKNSPQACIDHCTKGGLKYAGLQFGRECWCDDKFGRHGKVEEDKCGTICPGDKSTTCGGYLTMRIFSTGLPAKIKNPSSLASKDSVADEPPVKIVFILTFNGRQIRQVIRLIRAVYHPDHYYYIHVDKREEYLFRELLPLEKRLHNVRLTRQRFSTIWGGASLLQAHLTFMKEVLGIREWKWDYYINLSESDYPIKRIDELVNFLKKYNGYSFLKSHGSDTHRFIQKQGLEQTFYECDNHLWRLGPRALPTGIRIDGGSDWIGVYRTLAEYVIQQDDELLRGLKNLFKFTLLPVESFFHTLSQNSKFCDKIIDNNLHLTNWRRKQGCKCQYKHIVDWCGCSPNDFKTTDLDKLMNYEDKPVFFARKFEAIVNQEIINSIDVYLFGDYGQDMTALSNYWQNEFHHLDKNTKTRDAYLTAYHSFMRRGLLLLAEQFATCKYRPIKVLEANIFYESDHFHGLLVLYQAEDVTSGNVITMETHMHPKTHYSVLNPIGSIGRLLTLEIGTNFDPKELIFRNYASLIGPYDEPVLRHVWGPGTEFVISVAWIDPSNVIAASYDVKIPASSHIGNHNPLLKSPLRPGIWTVRLMENLKLVAETKFLVFPLQFYQARSISTSDIHQAHSGPDGYYAKKDFSELRTVLKVPKDERLEAEAVTNARKVGKDLEKWIDGLSPLFWQVQNSCAIEDVSSKHCPQVAKCRLVSWSSRSPDPKSELSAIVTKLKSFRKR